MSIGMRMEMRLEPVEKRTRTYYVYRDSRINNQKNVTANRNTMVTYGIHDLTPWDGKYKTVRATSVAHAVQVAGLVSARF